MMQNQWASVDLNSWFWHTRMAPSTDASGSPILMATRCLQRGVVPLVGNGHLLHIAKETLLSMFFVFGWWTKLTSGHCENSKKVTCNLPGLLCRTNDFWVVHRKRVEQKFRNKVFWIINKNRSIKLSKVAAVMFSVRESPREPNGSDSFYPKNINVFWSMCGFSGTKLKIQKTKILSAAFLLKCPKNFLSRSSH